MSILLALILPALAHVTSDECQTLYKACLSQADVVITPLPIDPPAPSPSPVGAPWECYYKSLSADQQRALREIARKRRWTPEQATIWHYEAPGWGGRARGAKWGCETAPVGGRIAGAGLVWKPVSESRGGRLVVLLPASWERVSAIQLRYEGKTESCPYEDVGGHNGGRHHYWCSRPGSGYPPGTVLVIGDREATVPHPAQRYEDSIP